jgi:cytoskeletal protein CcmA (bactofilin family)
MQQQEQAVAGEMERGPEQEEAHEQNRWLEDRPRSLPRHSDPTLPDEVGFVGNGVDFKGVVTYSGTVRINGAVDGEIHTDGGLVVGPEAVIKATVTAGTVVCHGHITGDVKATSQIVLCAPAVVEGSLTTPVLSMEEGVVFNGKLEMNSKVEALRATGANLTSRASRPSIRLAA